MKFIAVLVFITLFSNQNNAYAKSMLPIEYLEQTPVIDGQLDHKLKHLIKRDFSFFFQFDNPTTKKIPVSYKLGYTSTHLYIYIEVQANKIDYHRRGYLWGDGYKVLLAIPQKENETNEYYDLTFSPSLDKTYWDRQRVSVFNFKSPNNNFSDKTQSQEKSTNTVSGFEALIAWSDIEPYHPWFLNKIGFNIYFAKAVQGFTNGYAVVEDEGIWDEELAMRNYQLIEFKQPKHSNKQIILAKPKELNLNIGESLIIDTISIAKRNFQDEKLIFTLKNADSEKVFQQIYKLELTQDLNKKSYSLDTTNLITGTYTLTIGYPNKTSSSYEIGVLPEIDFKSISNNLYNNKNKQSIGIINTLMFKLLGIKDKFSELRSYESGKNIFKHWSKFKNEYQQFTKAINPYNTIGKPHRRAFKSKYDNTYQPYTIKLPQNYDAKHSYPLLVFLHGSGQDEQNILNKARSGGDFIELAPFARDKFRAYASVDSQNDIIEAIEDVKKNFSVNNKSIIIGGFSMGGYGALRSFYEHPEIYKGVAVFAGHPNLASEWLGETHPNFLNDSYLHVFKNVPVFIYHGEKDAALPINLAKKLSGALKNNGAVVTNRFIKNKAHEYPDTETNQVYFNWLTKIVEDS